MLKRLMSSGLIGIFSLFSFVFFMPTAQVGAIADGCNASFFGLPAWYTYLESTGPPECEITGPKDPDGEFSWQAAAGLVAVAVVDALLRVAGLVAVGYVVYGGFRYITSQGNPDGANSARQTIINALIGVVIAVAASSIVRFVANRMTS